MRVPGIRYAEVDGISIGYQVFGTGRNVVGIPGFAQNIELLWDEPRARRFFERMAEVCRVVHYDKRGTGASDRSLPQPTLDERAADVLAVMGAAGVDRAVLAGFSEGATIAAFVAATYPDRVEGLVLSGGTASFAQCDDHPWAAPREQALTIFELVAAGWGTGTITADFYAPSMAQDAVFRTWAARSERQSITPTRIAEFARYIVDLDIRHLLGSVRAPTVVMHGEGDLIVPIESGRYLADHIPGARFVELPLSDHAIWFGNQDAYLATLTEFLTGSSPPPESNRVLATVLFSDIVDSTTQATARGDDEWVRILDAHDTAATEVVERWGGRLVKSTGDGLLATFDGPSRAVHAASELVERVRARTALEVRVGMHSGEIELRGADIAGVAVHLAARIESVAPRGGVTVSRTVKDLVAGSGLKFVDRGEHTLKGIDRPWQLFDVAGDG